MNQLNKFLFFGFVLALFCHCERDDRFYRPRVPQKISALAIIDADDTSRFILFEKTFQVEYPEDLTDSLRDFSFTISGSKDVILSFHSEMALESPFSYRIPDSVDFLSGEKYFFRANERDCPEVYSEITTPEPPSGLRLASTRRETEKNSMSDCYALYEPFACIDVFNIKFDNDITGNLFFAVMVESNGQAYVYECIENITVPHNYYPPRVIAGGDFYTRFSVMKSDAHGFVSVFPGLFSYNINPLKDNKLIEGPAPAYYIDGSKAQDKSIGLVLTNRSHDGVSVPIRPNTYKIRLLSLPREMYQFSKNLYEYQRNLDDPFAEPVYLKGNIEGGYGIFAICRSIEINIEAPLQIWSH